MNNLNNLELLRIEQLEQLAIVNNEKIVKLQRLIYLLKKGIKLNRGRNGGIYYKTKNSIIYI